MGVDMEREQLRRAAHGPCKQACLLFGEMAFTIHKAQVRQRIDSARDKASAQFYSDARLQRLGEQQRQRAVASFEQQLEHTLGQRERQFDGEARGLGLDSVKHCMARCVGKRHLDRIDDFCSCIERAGDFHIASQCFAGE